ncbi:MAG: hypothetical protein KDD45_04400 [Bdellovibrionales bacterium]|nr:hypothetical protein [Bdellovibrionales bacterium]
MLTTYVSNTDGSTSPRVTLDDGSQVVAVLSKDGCNQYQVFWNGKCIRAIYQCLVYQDNALCKICGNGWLRTIYGDCEV